MGTYPTVSTRLLNDYKLQADDAGTAMSTHVHTDIGLRQPTLPGLEAMTNYSYISRHIDDFNENEDWHFTTSFAESLCGVHTNVP